MKRNDVNRAPRPDSGRTCLGCGAVRPREELLRMVRGPEGTVLYDPAGALPGRGAYACPTRECMAAALDPRKLRRAFRQETRPVSPAEALEALTGLTRRRLLNLAGLAARAGAIAGGHDHVLRTLAAGQARFLLLAVDLAARTRRDIEEGAAGIPLLRLGTIDELGHACGRPGCGILAVTDPAIALRLRRVYDQIAALDLDLSGGGIPS